MRKIKNFLNIFVIPVPWSKTKENIILIFSIFLFLIYVYLFYAVVLNHHLISNNEFLFLFTIAIFGAFFLTFVKFKDKPQVTKRILKTGDGNKK